MKILALALALATVVSCGPSVSSPSPSFVATLRVGTSTPPADPVLTPTDTVAPAVSSTVTSGTTPVVSEEFKTLVKDFLAKGGHVVELVNSGVAYFPFGAAVGDAFAAYDKLNTAWPTGTGNTGLHDTNLAIQGWEFAKQLWHDQVSQNDEPTEPDFNSYPLYIKYAGDSLVLEVRPQNFPIPAYRGKHFLPFDKNIPILLGKADDYFKSAQAALLKFLPSQ